MDHNMTADTPGLIFVYNADSGMFNTAADIAHKALSPDTYTCDLCALTHGYFKIRQEWVAFVKELPVETEFLHRDEYIKRHGETSEAFPAVFITTGNDQELFLSRDQIAGCDDLDALKQLVRSKLEEQGLA